MGAWLALGASVDTKTVSDDVLAAAALERGDSLEGLGPAAASGSAGTVPDAWAEISVS